MFRLAELGRVPWLRASLISFFRDVRLWAPALDETPVEVGE